MVMVIVVMVMMIIVIMTVIVVMLLVINVISLVINVILLVMMKNAVKNRVSSGASNVLQWCGRSRIRD